MNACICSAAIPADTLARLGLRGLPRDFALPITIRGTTNDPTVDLARSVHVWVTPPSPCIIFSTACKNRNVCQKLTASNVIKVQDLKVTAVIIPCFLLKPMLSNRSSNNKAASTRILTLVAHPRDWACWRCARAPDRCPGSTRLSQACGTRCWGDSRAPRSVYPPRAWTWTSRCRPRSRPARALDRQPPDGTRRRGTPPTFNLLMEFPANQLRGGLTWTSTCRPQMDPAGETRCAPPP